MKQATCYCTAYAFPHRKGGGACQVEFDFDVICLWCGGITSVDFVGTSCCGTDWYVPGTTPTYSQRRDLDILREQAT